jgi:hypothetical protein
MIKWLIIGGFGYWLWMQRPEAAASGNGGDPGPRQIAPGAIARFNVLPRPFYQQRTLLPSRINPAFMGSPCACGRRTMAGCACDQKWG